MGELASFALVTRDRKWTDDSPWMSPTKPASWVSARYMKLVGGAVRAYQPRVTRLLPVYAVPSLF